MVSLFFYLIYFDFLLKIFLLQRSKYFHSLNGDKKKNFKIEASKSKYPDSDFTDDDQDFEQTKPANHNKPKNSKSIVSLIKNFKPPHKSKLNENQACKSKREIEYLKVSILDIKR